MALVIYDSTYGNTKRIAEAIAETLGVDTKCISIDDVQIGNLQNGLVVIGCPINAWHPTPKVIKFLKDLAPSGLAGVKAASFDTRINSFFSGNAAKKNCQGIGKGRRNYYSPPAAILRERHQGPFS